MIVKDLIRELYADVLTRRETTTCASYLETILKVPLPALCKTPPSKFCLLHLCRNVNVDLS